MRTIGRPSTPENPRPRRRPRKHPTVEWITIDPTPPSQADQIREGLEAWIREGHPPAAKGG